VQLKGYWWRHAQRAQQRQQLSFPSAGLHIVAHQGTCLGAVKLKDMFCAVTKSQLIASRPLSASWTCTCAQNQRVLLMMKYHWEPGNANGFQPIVGILDVHLS